MAAYLATLVDITDPDAYQEYAERAGAVAEKRGVKIPGARRAQGKPGRRRAAGPRGHHSLREPGGRQA